MDKVIQLVKNDPLRIDALACVKELSLPQCYLAAGFVRNMVWDALHKKSVSTPLNDVDVVYYNPCEADSSAYRKYEDTLCRLMPHINWQVRNQATMHHQNHDKPYVSTIDAMGYWPEKETAVAIREVDNGRYECVSAFGFDSLFQ